MPYKIVKEGNGYFVVNETTGKKMNKSPHESRQEALEHQKALYAAEEAGKMGAKPVEMPEKPVKKPVRGPMMMKNMPRMAPEDEWED